MKLFVLAVSAILFQSAPAPKATIEGTVSHAGTGLPLSGVRVILARAPAAAPNTTPAQGPPPPPPPPPPSPPGLVQGGTAAPAAGTQFITTFSNNASGAQLPAGSTNLPSATTDNQGRYSLKDLEPGNYRVTFAANGYVKQDYGQRAFVGQGTTLVVSANQNLKDINMAMTAAGNVSGRLRDSSGMPAPGVPVQLFRASYNTTGQKGFQAVESDKSDDRGEFRLFWVSPGRYYVNAGTPPGPANRPVALGGAGNSPNQVPGESFVYSYFPGVTNINQAVPIEVGPGSEVSGIDFVVSRQQLLNIRGKVIDQRTGQAPASASISLSYSNLDGGGSFSNGNSYNAATGTFELTNLIPGSYTIQASVQESVFAGIAPDAARSSSRAVSSVSMPIDAFNGDLENVVLSLAPTMALPGRVTVTGTALPSLAAVRIQLRSSMSGVVSPNFNVNGVQIPTTNADGTFRVESVIPGEYRVGVIGMPQDYYVKEVQYNQREALDKPMVVSSGDSGTLEVIVSSGAVQINGSAIDDKSMPVPGVTVVLIPDQHRDRTELYKNANTDSTGRYSIRGVPPGDYKLFAWNSIASFDWFDPAILGPDESRGKPVHVIESSNQTVDLKTINEQ
jgi:5-hydroxyisourate hydrolase-like protein (transthyretin family)